MIYLGHYFTKPSKFYPVPCIHAFFITVQRVYWTLFIFCLTFSSMAILKVGRQGSSSSHRIYNLPLVCLESSHWVFLFYKVHSSTPWPFGTIIKGYYLIWRVSTRFWFVRRFRKDSIVSKQTSWQFLHELSWGFCSNILGFILFCCRVSVVHLTAISLRLSCGSHYRSLCYLIKVVSSRLSSLACFVISGNVLGSVILTFLYACPLTKIYILALFPSLPQAFLLLTSLLFSCISRRDYNSGNCRKLLELFFRGLIYESLLHIVTFKSGIRVS